MLYIWPQCIYMLRKVKLEPTLSQMYMANIKKFVLLNCLTHFNKKRKKFNYFFYLKKSKSSTTYHGKNRVMQSCFKRQSWECNVVKR